MAAEKLDFSPSLFKHDDGRPMSFCMRPCMERKTLKPIIEHGGGTISYRETSDCIKLLEPGGSAQSCDDLIKSQFVLDCAKANRFLDMSLYRCKSSGPVCVDDGMSPEPHIIHTTTSIKGRQKYVPADDKKIVEYLTKERRFTEANGKKLWRDMALFEVTNHTAESMRTRYLKYILPNIKSYNFPKHWVAMLTGNTKDALCQNHDKTPAKKKQESVSDQNSEHENSPSILKPLSPFHHQNSSKTSAASNQKPQKHSRSVLTGTHNSQCESPITKSPYFENNNNNEAAREVESASEDEFDKMLIETAETSGDESDNRLEIIQKQKQKKITKSPSKGTSQKTQESPKVALGQKQTPRKLHVNGNTSQTICLKNGGQTPKVMPKKKQMSPRSSNLSAGRDCESKEDGGGGGGASSSSSPDSYDRLLMECGGRMEAQLKEAFVMEDTESPRSKTDKKVSSPRKTQESCIKRVPDLDAAAASTSQNKPKKKKTNGKESPKKPKKNIKTLHQFVMEDTESDDSQSEESSSSDLELEQNDSDQEMTSDYIQVDLQRVSLFLMCLIVFEAAVTGNLFDNVGESFGLTLREMYHILYINTGCMEDAIAWIKFGVDTKGYPAWTKEEDAVLQGHEEEDQVVVEKRHGAKRTQARKAFLLGL